MNLTDNKRLVATSPTFNVEHLPDDGKHHTCKYCRQKVTTRILMERWVDPALAQRFEALRHLGLA